MAVRGMPSSAYAAMPQRHFIPRNPEGGEYDHSLKVIYNQFFYGPVEQQLNGCNPELEFQYDKADKTKIMVTFSRCAPGDGAAKFSFPLGKLESISYSEKAIILHFNEHSASAKHLHGILNANQEIESKLCRAKAPQSTDFAKRQLIFLVDQTQHSIVRGSSSAYLKDFQMFSGWIVPPLKKNKRQLHTFIGSRFIEHLDDSKWTEFLQALFLEVDPRDSSKIVYQYDVVRNHSSAPVSYKQIKDEWVRPGGKRLHNGLPVPDYSVKSNSASSSPADHSRPQQNGGRPPVNTNRGTYNLMEDPSTISLHDVTSAMNNISHKPSGLELEEPIVQSSQPKAIVAEAPVPVVTKPEKAPTPPKHANTAIELLDDDDEMNVISSILTGETKPKKMSILSPETELARFTPAGGKNKDSISVSLEDARVLAFNEMLNDSIIEFYLKYSVESTDDKSLPSRVHIFNSFFFQKITDGMKDFGQKAQRSSSRRFGCVASNFTKVKNWTRRIDIFSKDIVIVPINTDIHWFCVVIINPRAAISDEALTEQQLDAARNSNSPMKAASPAHIFLLDSMPEPGDWKRAATADIILDYLEMELMDKKKCQLHRQKIGKLYLRNVPKQSNMIDCGLYLLAFVEAIFRKPPSIEMLNMPRLDFRDLYPHFEITPLDHMRDKVVAVLRKCAGPEKWNNLAEFERNKGMGVTIASGEALVDRARRPRRYSDSSFPFVEKAPGFLSRLHSEPPAYDRIPMSLVLRRE